MGLLPRMTHLLCDFCHRRSVDQVLGIPHCYLHLVEAVTLAEAEADLSGQPV